MTLIPYRLTGPIGSRATLGLIVLQVDETIEQDFRRLFTDPQIALHISRIPSGDDLNPDTIGQMAIDLPRAAALLPPAAAFDSVAYACTSGTTLIGADRVADMVKAATHTRHVADPLSAALAALAQLKLRTVGIVSPYIDSVSQPIRRAFEAAGFAVPTCVSFGETIEARVARIDPASIREAALAVGRSAGVEAVFLSCTNLRTLDILDDLEQTLGLPVISSNQALAWFMARQCGLTMPGDAPGGLTRDLRPSGRHSA